ncbi:MAG TPA: alkaline phosphatase PafA [Balneolaceae bacterium]|nr:alkaline phosphatase PafA [Balneolaceae bacterium]
MTGIWKKGALLPVMLLLTTMVRAQTNPAKQETMLNDHGPKLVVGIVIDQMRYDYLPMYWDKFENGGFKRLVNQGYSFANNHYNYVPTYTGPGHAAIYTGTTPSVNGIVGNDWYDRSAGHNVYVVSDSMVSSVGTESDAGKMSPANLWSTTVTDQLKLAKPGSKVIAVSIKDRAAVLPAGHMADGAYWYDGDSGNFISSSWYMDKLPKWVQSFNEEGLARTLSQKTWETLLPITRYTESNPDNSPYEEAFAKEETPVFPHKLGDYANDSYNIVKSSPYGNTLLEAFAKKTVEGEGLGADDVTDFLAISFSSTDYVGHQFGPHSIELEDTYLRLDRDLADFFDYLDKKVGKGNYMVMLTADHGVVDVPAELMDEGLPGGYFNSNEAMAELSDYLNAAYGDGKWIESYINGQVYLNRDSIEEQDIPLENMQRDVADFLRGLDGVQSTNTATNFEYRDYNDGLQAMYKNGFHYDRSGDVYIQLKPGWLDSSHRTGTSHGSPYNYDTHVPLLFYGWNIPHGKTSQKTVITQVAPTISAMLNIDYPSGSEAEVLSFEN